MRYDPRNRITFPHFEDAALWKVLDNIGVKYDKIPRVCPPDASARENWFATARVWLDDERFGLIDFQEARLLNQTAYATINQRSIQARDKKYDAWRVQGVPLLLVSRRWHEAERVVCIKKWLSELKGNSDSEGQDK